MGVYKLSAPGTFKTERTLYKSFLTGNPAVIQDAGAMFPLGEFTLAANQTTVTFSNIPQTYTHLQLRFFARQAGSWLEGSYFSIRLNNDTGNNYANHSIRGNGSTASSGGNSSVNLMYVNRISNAYFTSNIFGAGIIDILDYRNTNKTTTVRTLAGFDANGSGEIAFNSGLWTSTAAVTSISLGIDTGDFITNSQFSLYGVLA